ncbi:MAG: IS5 family transposase [Pseudomonadota bacterium]
MQDQDLTDSQWERLRELVPGGRKGKRGPRSDGRRFLNALLWMARSGGRWRDLPERYGNLHTVKTRYYRWLRAGHIDRLFHAVMEDPDLEWIAVDATIIRANAQAAGARRKRGGGNAQALGRSRGGFGTKLHAVTDALGLPIRFVVGPGQQNEMAAAYALIKGIHAGAVLADRAYDADGFHDLILEQGGRPVIPPRRTRRHQHDYDRALYAARHSIECFFGKLKQFRRVATRYDKLAETYLGFVKLAAIHIWLR